MAQIYDPLPELKEELSKLQARIDILQSLKDSNTNRYNLENGVWEYNADGKKMSSFAEPDCKKCFGRGLVSEWHLFGADLKICPECWMGQK